MKHDERNTRREDDSRTMKVVESFLTRNPCYKTNRKIAVQGVALYTVGCPQPSAKVFINNWNNEKHSRACVHAFIDAYDGTVYQTLPWNHRGWHGNAENNNSRVGVMLCEPHQIKYRKDDVFDVVGNKDDAILATDRVYQSAVELCGQLCVKYNLDPKADIWAPTGGISDPEHLWKGLEMDYTMEKFRADVVDEMGRIRGVDSVEQTTSEGTYEVIPGPHLEGTPSMEEGTYAHAEGYVPNPYRHAEGTRITNVAPDAHAEGYAPNPYRCAEGTFVTNVAKKSESMRVRVNYDNLRIRSGPGTNYATTGSYTGKGIFNITEIQNGTGSKSGWGKLEDGSGWISMDFAEKL